MFLDENDKSVKWRDDEFPDYTVSNLAYLKGKSRNHKQGSLAEFVENFVKSWEMEQVHKIDPK